MAQIAFIYDDVFLNHVTPPGHPERPDRLRSLVSALRSNPDWESYLHVSPAPASEEDILQVHSHEHLELVRETCATGGGLVDDGDTHVVRQSFDAAILAAGAVISGIDSVLRGQVSSAFCAVRPPGHHATPDRPMGFCLFNNVAIGLRYAQKNYKVNKVAVVDWDVHHGNGTQDIFSEDPSVLFISLHQYPFWPGTGARSERGKGPGEGFTLNIPLPGGTGEERYLKAFQEEVLPAIADFSPELLMISAGFDAHRDDPLGGMKLTADSYAKFTRLIKTGIPIVSVLEGGYNLKALAGSVQAHLQELSK